MSSKKRGNDTIVHLPSVSNKKGKPNDEGPLLWSVEIEEPAHLETAIGVIHSAGHTEVCLKIMQTPKFEGIQLSSLNKETKSTMCKIVLPMALQTFAPSPRTVTIEKDGKTIEKEVQSILLCVQIPVFLKLLQSLTKSNMLVLRSFDQATIHYQSYSPNSMKNYSQGTIKTISSDGNTPMDFARLEFPVTLDISLSEFRSTINSAVSNSASDITLVTKTKTIKTANKTKVVSLFFMSCTTPMIDMEKVFPSTCEINSENKLIMKALDPEPMGDEGFGDCDGYEEKTCARFDAKILQGIVKCMPNLDVMLSLDSSHPLIITYNFGEGAHIFFVVGPKRKEGDDQDD